MNLFFLLLPLWVAVLIVAAFHRVRPRAAWIVGGALAAWFALVTVLAVAGVLSEFETMPPRVPVLAFGAIALGVGLSRLREVRAALDEMPAWWPVAIQGFRFPLELALFALFTTGLMPEQMTFSGRNFDVLVGVSAPVMAWAMATGRAPRVLQLAWQAGAVGLLVNVVSIAITSVPGPMRGAWPGEPLTVVTTWPYALLPGFLVPVAALGHLAAVRAIWKRAPLPASQEEGVRG
jgi:hypothetical protein